MAKMFVNNSNCIILKAAFIFFLFYDEGLTLIQFDVD